LECIAKVGTSRGSLHLWAIIPLKFADFNRFEKREILEQFGDSAKGIDVKISRKQE
jgi:hypothetical protein